MNRTVAKAVSAAIGLTVAGWLGSGSAWAQNAAPAAGSDAATAQNSGAAGAGQLQEVVVTAERRAENVQTTPIAVNAISGSQLQQEHVNTLQDLPTVAPIVVTNSGWHQQINIRGIGNSVISASINIGIAVIRDGLFEAETLGENEPMYDIADTEVLRGPQGTFVGYASTGGAVEINSANPNFRGVNGYVQASVGNYTDRALQGAVNLQATDTLAFRFAFNDETRNSFYKDVGSIVTAGASGPNSDPGNVNNQDLRIGMLWKPSDSFQALLKTAYDSERSDGLASQVDPGTYTCPVGYGPNSLSTGVPIDANCPAAGVAVHAPYYANATHDPFVLNANRLDQKFDTQKSETGLELRWTFPNQMVLRSMTGFEQIAVQLNQDSDATNSLNGTPGVTSCVPGAVAGGDCGQWQFRMIPPDDYYSQEIDLISPTTGRLTWIAGATVFYRDTPVDSSTYTGSTPFSPTAPQYSISSTHSIERLGGEFGQINWQMTDTLQLQIGARHNWDSNYSTGNSVTYTPNSAGVYGAPRYSGTDSHGNSCAPQGLTQYGCIGKTYTDSVPTGKVDLNWTPVPGQFFYVFWARGYKSGGINAGDGTTFQPEHVDDYELGWKGNLLENRIQTQVGGYWMSYKNYQYSLLIPSTDGVSSSSNDVVGLPTATIKGIEASMQAHVAHIDFNVGIYYNKSALGSLRAVATYTLPSTLSTTTPGCATTTVRNGRITCFNYGPYYVNLSGEQNAFSPQLTASADLGYQIPLGNGTFEPRVTYSHTDKQYGSIFQSDTYWLMPARNLWGADLQYTAGPWLVDAYATNLTNETYISGYYGAGGNLNDVFYGAPRQYGLRLNYTF
jgi:iron complex outermembrane receptor protein